MTETKQPEVVAHCGPALESFIDPTGALQKAGLLVVDRKLTRHEHFERLNAYAKDPAYLAKGSGRYDFGALVGQKWEIDKDLYWYFLEVLPPIGYRGGAFYMREFLTEDITSYYSKVGNRYFHEYRRAPARIEREAMA